MNERCYCGDCPACNWGRPGGGTGYFPGFKCAGGCDERVEWRGKMCAECALLQAEEDERQCAQEEAEALRYLAGCSDLIGGVNA
jgi:hypothetical protein